MSEFLKAYEEVFDTAGNVKPCGREKCKRLIILADKLETGVSHGDACTGIMDINSIKSLYAEQKE